jgi:hypothetical protein
MIESHSSLEYCLNAALFKQLFILKVCLQLTMKNKLLPKLRQDFASVPNRIFASLRDLKAARWKTPGGILRHLLLERLFPSRARLAWATMPIESLHNKARS